MGKIQAFLGAVFVMKAKNLSLVMGLLFVFLLSTATPVLAHEGHEHPLTTPVPIAYQLPYPGILPGHPFYFLKQMRDNISGFFISNPLKKADFDLLQADKNIATAESLDNQKKDMQLVVAAIIRSENYFSDALQKGQEARKQGMDSKDLLKRLHMANLKHQEIIMNMIQTASDKDAQTLTGELEKLKELEKKTK